MLMGVFETRLSRSGFGEIWRRLQTLIYSEFQIPAPRSAETFGLVFPDHILEVIFSKLPIFNLPVCRIVCKSWNDLVLNSKFQIPNGFLAISYDFIHKRVPEYANPKMHCVDSDSLGSVAAFEFDTEDLKSLKFHNSCNGLVYITKRNSSSRCDGILNPVTNEFLAVPLHKPNFDEHCIFGFGFSPKTNKYKLFRITFDSKTSTCRMEVFRFSTHNQWRLVSRSLPFVYYQNAAYLNGFVYWIALENQKNECLVYAVDVDTEQIESAMVLKLDRVPMYVKIESFNGTIYVIVYLFGPHTFDIQVWRMQGKDSWIRDFVVHDKECRSSCDRLFHFVKGFHLVKALDDGGMVVLIKDEYFCLDKMGSMMKMKKFDRNARLVNAACNITSFNFGSLHNILAEHE